MCSVASQMLDESAFGTAATARSWICLEQNGPFGQIAATQSHLDPDLGRTLDARAASAGGRLALIRRPGRHSDDGTPEHREHTVFVAWADLRLPWLLRGRTDDPRALLALDSAALAAGDLDAVVASAPDLRLVRQDVPVLLVCTNGRRDLCCAVRGRPVALGAAARRPGQVWETSHTGGHRFAPTAVLLPSGSTLGRLDRDLAVAALDGAAVGELPLELHGPRHDRGRSALAAPLQAAEAAARQHWRESRLDAVSCTLVETTDDASWRVSAVHRDGRAHTLSVRLTTSPATRPASCGKPDQLMTRFDVHIDAGG